MDGKVILPILGHESIEYQIGVSSKIIVKDGGIYVNICIGAFFSLVNNTLEIEISVIYRNLVRGICSVPPYSICDLYSGPKGCLYSDMNLFIRAWTTPLGNWCDLKDYYRHYAEIATYQHTCEKKRFC